MATCTSCGSDVTGKKFCPECGTAVQVQSAPAVCPRCNGEVKPGAAFCMHCGSALSGVVQAPPAIRTCPACHTTVSPDVAFCTNCGHDLRTAAPTSLICPACGRQNAVGVRFCAGCGNQLGIAPAAQPQYQQQQQYSQQPQYQQQYPQQQQYQQQPQYPQQQQYLQQPQYQQQYPQPYAQGGYQQQPMIGQQPMVLRCPTCMAMAPMGTPACPSCRTNLAGVVPTPAQMPVQGQQGGLAGFMQGDGGKYAMGALGGAAAVIGGEMLLHGVENVVENRVEGDIGFENRHHHRREEGLGGLGEIANDLGLF